ncbi:LuxR C-terminal-related transcriptional regulator [Kitasatospora sp. NPDC008050]|uniref:helix-turn-helix transcriptional regulator n=1 Tax=Kitasatospora sp. NPDC008050 TaxID=3364021 RepID=UPI0036E26F44
MPAPARGAISPMDLRLYGLICRQPDSALEELALAAGCAVAEAEQASDRLSVLGLLAPAPASACGYVTVDPEAALTRLFASEERQTSAYLQKAARTRENIAAVMRDFAELRNQRTEAVEIETLPSPALVNAFLEDAGSMTRSRMRSMHPGGPPPVEMIDQMLLRDSDMHSRGISVQTLYQRRTAEVPYMASYLADAVRPGREARVAEFLPIRMLIFDDDVAVLPIHPQDSAQGAVAIRGRSLVRSLTALYDYCWLGATVVRKSAEPREPVLDGQELSIVRMLADGVKDESIARHLDISPRTLSRIISGLLERLGAQTRFQAALRVAELGLLTPP